MIVHTKNVRKEDAELARASAIAMFHGCPHCKPIQTEIIVHDPHSCTCESCMTEFDPQELRA